MNEKETEAAIHLLARAVYMTTISVQNAMFVLERDPALSRDAQALRNAVNNLQDVQARIDHLIIEEDQ